jgi:hypothetical protein
MSDTILPTPPTHDAGTAQAPATVPTARPKLECFNCGEPAITPAELLLVDHLIESSPCFKDISENFAHCTGDDSLFHDNIVNCCAACYAAIVETVAPCAEDSRRAEVANLARALRDRPDVPVKVLVTLERLVENLVAVGPAPRLTREEIGEAIYCASSDHYYELA